MIRAKKFSGNNTPPCPDDRLVAMSAGVLTFCWRISNQEKGLLQASLYLLQTGQGAGFVFLAAACTAYTDGTDNFIVDLE